MLACGLAEPMACASCRAEPVRRAAVEVSLHTPYVGTLQSGQRDAHGPGALSGAVRARVGRL